MVSPGIRGSHHTPVQHAGHTHVMHKHLFTADLGRNVDPRHALTDEAVLAGRLQRRRQRQGQRDVLCLQQLAIGALPRWVRTRRHHPALHLQIIRRNTQRNGGLSQQPGPGLRRSSPQRHGMNLQRGTGNRGPLVGRQCGAAQHRVHLGQRHVQLIGHQLRQCGANARAQVHMAVQCCHAAVVPHGQQNLHALGRIARDRHRLALDGWRRGWRLTRDEQHALCCMKISAPLGQIGSACHLAWPMRSAANSTAWMISRCVPQRHRLPDNSLRTSASLGFGFRASKAAAIMTMPLRQ